MKIIFIRHTSVDVPQGTIYGQTDVPLKDSFPEEAAKVLESIPDISFDAVYTSPLSRCVKLATFCGHADATRDDRLKEMSFGDWEMGRYDQIQDPNLKDWYDNWLTIRSTNGESFEDLFGRVSDFLQEMRASGHRNVLVFAHGGVLMSAMLYNKMCKVEEIFDHQPPYGGMLCLELTD